MKAYLVSVVAAALIVSAVRMIPQRKSISRIVTLCGGVYLLLVLLRPVLSLQFGELADMIAPYVPDPAVIDDAVAQGQSQSARLITQRTEEYILNKAESLGARIRVQITLQSLSGNYQYPSGVRIYGRWTAEQKRELREYISQTLGIPEERQIWNEEP